MGLILLNEQLLRSGSRLCRRARFISWQEKLLNILPNVTDGTRLTAVRDKTGHTIFYHDGNWIRKSMTVLLHAVSLIYGLAKKRPGRP